MQSEIVERDRRVHLSHCNQGEYAGSCKYGERATCPALTRPAPADEEAVAQALHHELAVLGKERGASKQPSWEEDEADSIEACRRLARTALTASAGSVPGNSERPLSSEGVPSLDEIAEFLTPYLGDEDVWAAARSVQTLFQSRAPASPSKNGSETEPAGEVERVVERTLDELDVLADNWAVETNIAEAAKNVASGHPEKVGRAIVALMQLSFVEGAYRISTAMIDDLKAISGLPDIRAVLSALRRPDDAMRKALEQIDRGTSLAFELFKARMGQRKSPTWYAVNVLQHHLEAAQGTARQALAPEADGGEGR